MGYYIIKSIESKTGILADVHKNMLGCRAYFLTPDQIKDGFPVYLKVDVHDKMGVEGMHTIRTSNVVKHDGEPGDRMVTIETRNTLYALESEITV